MADGTAGGSLRVGSKAAAGAGGTLECAGCKNGPVGLVHTMVEMRHGLMTEGRSPNGIFHDRLPFHGTSLQAWADERLFSIGRVKIDKGHAI